jgi:hypothetical protein
MRILDHHFAFWGAQEIVAIRNNRKFRVNKTMRSFISELAEAVKCTVEVAVSPIFLNFFSSSSFRLPPRRHRLSAQEPRQIDPVCRVGIVSYQ